MLRSLLALLMILLAAPACAGSRFGGGFHGGRFHGAGFPAFHRSSGLVLGFFGGYFCGYNCGLGFYNPGYGYGNGAGNAISISNGLTGSYVPDPVGADIPPLIIPKNCWVRRAAYDPSGAYFGHVLVNLCRPSDSVILTGLKVRTQTPDAATATHPPPLYRPGSPQLPQ